MHGAHFVASGRGRGGNGSHQRSVASRWRAGAGPGCYGAGTPFTQP